MSFDGLWFSFGFRGIMLRIRVDLYVQVEALVSLMTRTILLGCFLQLYSVLPQDRSLSESPPLPTIPLIAAI